MDEVRFAVDTAVWLDGVTFVPTVAEQKLEQPSFKETLANTQTAAPASDPVAAPRSAVVELPAALGDVEDLTPFVVGKDAETSAPGTRLDGELKRTTFQTAPLKRSPYNMSEARAKRREEALAQKELKGVKDEKLFPMNTAARYRGNGSGIAAQSVLQKPVSLSPADINAIAARAGTTDGYPRDSLPSASNEQTSAAAAWFPEAMTRQLDAYEAMKKVQAAQQQTDIKI